ncbi:hypothetical protein WS83_03440 [Burkholderia sp. MSMB2042]|nr:hypothetical protein WS78_26645 [Burkholderia savannae]KVG44203.1 hypothetical protein WS77_09735 [Burkholderia sp. MSMB0265]KVG87730.1 hypothetical protein WS81_25715 [Burkholderia sp. MSMB2040]KVG96426.1 hypothetical protein WS83_03440 [Burkholderia sp. MSMB2042]KVG97132.1 hypothetical protein WS82_29945 [Burkholderia sp. MSMB2041]
MSCEAVAVSCAAARAACRIHRTAEHRARKNFPASAGAPRRSSNLRFPAAFAAPFPRRAPVSTARTTCFRRATRAPRRPRSPA